jgi:hypothetical protein
MLAFIGKEDSFSAEIVVPKYSTNTCIGTYVPLNTVPNEVWRPL